MIVNIDPMFKKNLSHIRLCNYLRTYNRSGVVWWIGGAQKNTGCNMIFKQKHNTRPWVSDKVRILTLVTLWYGSKTICFGYFKQKRHDNIS